MTDRVRTLALFERLRRHEMMSEAGELAALRAQIAELERKRSDLLNRLRTEARIVSLEAAPYVGAYIRAIRHEVAQIDRALEKAAPRLEALEQEMAERFREIATIKLASERTLKEMRQAHEAREALEADAQTLIRWVRRPADRAAAQDPF